MRSANSAVVGCLALLVSTVPVSALASDQELALKTGNTVQPISGTTRRMPVAFTKNMGQWPENVLFRTNSGGATIWITRDGLVYQFTRRVEREHASSLARRSAGVAGAARDDGPFAQGKFGQEPDSIEQLVVRATLVDANAASEAVGLEELEYKCNYFVGNDPAGWRTDVPNYAAVMVKDVYPGMDVRYSADGCGQAVYEFIAAPGADEAQIKTEYEGAEEASKDAEGRLVVRTKWGHAIEGIEAPASRTGRLSPRPCSYSEATYGAPGSGRKADPSQSLAVGLSYSTYLGGGDYDEGYGIAVDGSGNAYVTGYTLSGDFPTQNPYQTDQGDYDVFVTKLSSTGNSLVYSTYLGGGGEDVGLGIGVDGSGCAYVTGYTLSTDFPTQNPYQTHQGVDVFVSKLSSAGNTLVYSTYLGGGSDDVGYGIAVDGSGNACVTGYTLSGDFPTQNPYQTDRGSWDVIVVKLSSTGNSLVYSTYLGGGGEDVGYSIALDGSGNAYVTGYTLSGDFPTQNSYQTVQGNEDAFVTKLSSTGSSLVYSTYLGGSGSDFGYGIAVDGSGCAYVTGYAFSTNFPIQNPYQTNQGNEDAFVTKLSSTGSSLIYSTYLGGSGSDLGYGIAVDGSGNAYVTGYTLSGDFPTRNPYQMDQGNVDAFVTHLSGTGDSLVYSTYLGGQNSADYARGIAVDGSGNAYVMGTTYSSDFPTQNPYQTDEGDADAFVAKLAFGCPITRTGDVNVSGSITSADIITLVNYVFKGGAVPLPCIAAGDANCSGAVTSADIIYLVNYVFKAGPLPCDVCTIIPGLWSCP